MSADIYTFIEFVGEGLVYSYAEVAIHEDHNLSRLMKKFGSKGLPTKVSGFALHKFFIPVIDEGKEKSYAGFRYITRLNSLRNKPTMRVEASRW